MKKIPIAPPLGQDLGPAVTTSLSPPGLLTTLRVHPKATPDLLETENVSLRPDAIPWLQIAQQILDGKFDGCDGSTRESLAIGLRSVSHPRCKRALKRLGVRHDCHESDQHQPRKGESIPVPIQVFFKGYEDTN